MDKGFHCKKKCFFLIFILINLEDKNCFCLCVCVCVRFSATERPVSILRHHTLTFLFWIIKFLRCKGQFKQRSTCSLPAVPLNLWPTSYTLNPLSLVFFQEFCFSTRTYRWHMFMLSCASVMLAKQMSLGKNTEAICWKSFSFLANL